MNSKAKNVHSINANDCALPKNVEIKIEESIDVYVVMVAAPQVMKTTASFIADTDVMIIKQGERDGLNIGASVPKAWLNLTYEQVIEQHAEIMVYESFKDACINAAKYWSQEAHQYSIDAQRALIIESLHHAALSQFEQTGVAASAEWYIERFKQLDNFYDKPN